MGGILWGEQTATQLAQAAQENALVILPLGCTEQHAAHLPVDTDTWQVEHFTQEGARLVIHDLGRTKGTVVLRMPLHPVAIELLREVGPMAVSSANISGQPPAVNADEARAQLGDKVEVYLDAGPATKQAASTIVDLTGMTPKILRPGPVSAERIAEVLGVDPDALAP